VKKKEMTDVNFEEPIEPDVISRREQPKLSEEATLEELPNQSEDLGALKSVASEGKSVEGDEKVRKMEKADCSSEEPKAPEERSGREQPKLSEEATCDELPARSEEDSQEPKTAKNTGKSVVVEEHLKSEETQKRSVAEAGLSGDAESSKKLKIIASESVNDQKCISTNLNVQKNIDQAEPSPLVDDSAIEKLDPIDKKNSNDPLKDMKQSVTLGRTKDDIARYLKSLETGELVNLCTKLCAADKKLFRVLSKPE